MLQDVAFSDLHALVEFIYHGEVNVHQRSLSSFLKTAEVLRVSGLTQQSDQTDRDEVRSSSTKLPRKSMRDSGVSLSRVVVTRENDDFSVTIKRAMEQLP